MIVACTGGRPGARTTRSFGLVLADKSDVIEDQHVILVELGDRALERELAPRDLQPLDEIAGACEQHMPAVLDERETDGGRTMGLAAAGRTSVIVPGVSAFEVRIIYPFHPRSGEIVAVVGSRRYGGCEEPVMPRARHVQRDLFEEAIPIPELQPEQLVSSTNRIGKQHEVTGTLRMTNDATVAPSGIFLDEATWALYSSYCPICAVAFLTVAHSLSPTRIRRQR
jgi:hypothetical protein